jgi:nucleotide-binding universal stress UspA family protein
MYRNILVPISFETDRPAPQALAVAQALRIEGGRITLLHVMEQIPSFAAEYLPEDHRAKAMADIGAHLRRLAQDVPGAAAEVVEGHSGTTIVDWATRHGVDLIVIASHRPGMQDYLLGSTAARVVRHAPCAVHVVR